MTMEKMFINTGQPKSTAGNVFRSMQPLDESQVTAT